VFAVARFALNRCIGMENTNCSSGTVRSATAALAIATMLTLLSACASVRPPTADTLPLGPAELRTVSYTHLTLPTSDLV